MQSREYTVERREGEMTAVVKVGMRGGRKVVAVYATAADAVRVAQSLNLMKGREV